MSTTVRHDFADPKIRIMVEELHRPTERWTANDNLVVVLASITCQTCAYDWPCPTEVDYEKWLHAERVEAERARMERMALELAEDLP